MNSLHDLLVDELKDIYDAEQQLLQALPRMAQKAFSEALRNALSDHLRETETQIRRLDLISESVGAPLTGKTCAAMQGLVAEGNEYLALHGRGPVLDAALVGAAQRVEHYEMAAYGNARALAGELGAPEVAQMLQDTLNEEDTADRKLTAICLSEILPASREFAPRDRNEEDAPGWFP